MAIKIFAMSGLQKDDEIREALLYRAVDRSSREHALAIDALDRLLPHDSRYRGVVEWLRLGSAKNILKELAAADSDAGLASGKIKPPTKKETDPDAPDANAKKADAKNVEAKPEVKPAEKITDASTVVKPPVKDEDKKEGAENKENQGEIQKLIDIVLDSKDPLREDALKALDAKLPSYSPYRLLISQLGQKAQNSKDFAMKDREAAKRELLDEVATINELPGLTPRELIGKLYWRVDSVNKFSLEVRKRALNGLRALVDDIHPEFIATDGRAQHRPEELMAPYFPETRVRLQAYLPALELSNEEKEFVRQHRLLAAHTSVITNGPLTAEERMAVVDWRKTGSGDYKKWLKVMNSTVVTDTSCAKLLSEK
jgi:hypothetical protein